MARRINSIAEIGMGPEPQGSDIAAANPNYDNLLGSALNWYNYVHDEKKAREFILAYLKRIKASKKMIDGVKTERLVTSYGWIARLIDRGAQLSDHHLDMFNSYLVSLVKEDVPAPAPAPAAPKIERVPDAPAYMGEVDGAIDDLMNGKPFDLQQFYGLHSVPIRGKKQVVALLEQYIDEFEAIKADVELSEGFIRPVRLNRVIKTLKDQIKAVPARKITKRATKKKAPKLDRFKHQAEFEGIKSLGPAKILSARKAWLYNTKYKHLTVLMASSELTINGSTIKGFDEEASFQVRLRKPMEVLPEIIKKKDKIMTKIKTKINKATGRCTEHTVILRTE